MGPSVFFFFFFWGGVGGCWIFLLFSTCVLIKFPRGCEQCSSSSWCVPPTSSQSFLTLSLDSKIICELIAIYNCTSFFLINNLLWTCQFFANYFMKKPLVFQFPKKQNKYYKTNITNNLSSLRTHFILYIWAPCCFALPTMTMIKLFCVDIIIVLS